MQSFRNLLRSASSTLWKLFWEAPLWVKVAIIFFIVMMINGNIAVSLILIGTCFWAIQHMFQSLIPKKKKRKK